MFDEIHTVTHEFVKRYGTYKQLLTGMTLIDKAMVLAYPQLLQEDRREALVRLGCSTGPIKETQELSDVVDNKYTTIHSSTLAYGTLT